ncbi:hypothetical protein [Levilactobacillus yonginensis]|uniref:hypothetical protein n=1 Tax=Levilactobacillus yonginensis TaxID=1054041 RepID=UPI00345CABED
MTKIKSMMTKVMLGAMTVTTLLATSAGASAATTSTVAVATPRLDVDTTVEIGSRPNAEIQPTKIRLKRVTTKAISSQVQTVIDASALNLDNRHTESQLK